MQRAFYLVRYLGIFFRELILANVEVVKLVLSPHIKIKPGFLAVPLDAKTDFEITSLANSITLTPGTISVHVSDDRKTLVIHALHIGDDPDDIRRAVKQTLEANILKWTRAGLPAESSVRKPRGNGHGKATPNKDAD
jgi:multicomponent Na+:H+ antiporter subunit E